MTHYASGVRARVAVTGGLPGPGSASLRGASIRVMVTRVRWDNRAFRSASLHSGLRRTASAADRTAWRVSTDWFRLAPTPVRT